MRREAVVVRRGLAHNRADGRHVVVLDAAAQRVGQQLLGDVVDELLGVARAAPARSPADAVECVPSGRARGVDRLEFSSRSATARSRRSSRARSRAGPSAVAASRTPDSRGAAPCAPAPSHLGPCLAVLLQRRHIRRRRRRRRAEQVLEHPFAAHDRRRAVRIRRHRQDAALPEQAAARAVVGQRRRAGNGCPRRSECRSAARAAR